MIENYFQHPDPTSSRGVTEPEAQLLTGILIQTILDLRSPNILKSFDALLFFMDPQGAETFLYAIMGYQLEPYKIIDTISGGSLYAKTQLKRFAIQHSKKHVRNGKAIVCQGAGANLAGLCEPDSRKGQGPG